MVGWEGNNLLLSMVNVLGKLTKTNQAAGIKRQKEQGMASLM